MISQCPNCKTRFVVSEAQLAAAQGNVRCGSCMKVFFAASPEGDQPEPSKSELKTTSVTPANNTPVSPKENNPSENHDGTAQTNENTATDNWLSQLLPDAAKTESLEPITAQPDTVTATDISALSKDLQSNPLEAQKLNQERLDREHIPAKQPHSEHLDEPVFGSHVNEERFYTDGRIEPSLNKLTGFDALNRIDSQPVEISPTHDGPSLSRLFHKIAALLICLLLLGLLAMQWLLNHPEDFQYHPRWQGIYQAACQLSECTPAISVTDYRTLSLLVRDHPSREDALSVETTILNSSENSLPFPLIEMHFTDLAGNTSAYRQFTAEEYLHGELSGADTMVPATPIQIALAIKDPGPDAVNYTIKLLTP